MNAYTEQGAQAKRDGKPRTANPYELAVNRRRGRGRLSAVRARVMLGRRNAWNAGYDAQTVNPVTSPAATAR
jgi:hypothetical protein